MIRIFLNKYLILTDSLSSLHSIANPYPTNPITQRIFVTLSSLYSNNTFITFLWIPGHVGFPNHDKVDQAAKTATSLPKITDPTPSPPSDLKTYYRSLIIHSWHTHWKNLTSNKLNKIKSKPIPWSSSNRTSRHEETLLARLRIGHTRLTHAYLFLGLFSPATCPYCNNEILSIVHIFSCPHLHHLRVLHKVSPDLSLSLSNNHDTVTRSLHYLRSTVFYPLL